MPYTIVRDTDSVEIRASIRTAGEFRRFIEHLESRLASTDQPLPEGKLPDSTLTTLKGNAVSVTPATGE